MTSPDLADAQETLASARDDPKSTIARAESLLSSAPDTTSQATLHFALGLAHRALAAGRDSTHHFETAAGLAAADGTLRGKILRSLAFNYAQAGQHKLADQTIAESIALLDGWERDISNVQKAYMLMTRGDHSQALPVLSRAIKAFEETESDQDLELALFNRALIYKEFGDYDASAEDLERAYDLAMTAGNKIAAADNALHLSQVLGWRDDVAAAMKWHARSVSLREAAGAPNALSDAEHAEVLIQARLLREAEDVLSSAIPRLVDAGGNQAIAVWARLLLADVLTERGEFDLAMDQVQLAGDETPPDGRWRFDVAASAHNIRARSGEVSRELISDIISTADDMDANGERHAAALERLQAVRIALDLDDPATAETLIAAANRVAQSGPLWLQIRAWTAIAEYRLAIDNRRGAAAAARAGMNRLASYRGGIGSTDLRMRAWGLGERLAGIGIALAIRSGSAARAFAWAELLRTTAGGAPQASSPELDAALADLRRVAATARTAPTEKLKDSQRRLLAAESRVRTLTRQAEGSQRDSNVRSLPAVQDRLGHRVILLFVEDEGNLHAVVADAATATLVDLGPTAETGQLMDHLRFAAERIARPSTSDSSRKAAIASTEAIYDSLRDLLIAPLELDATEVVVIPTGVLHGVPWNSLFGVPAVVAPSATAWLTAADRREHAGPPLVVSGPGLMHAAAEASEIAATIGASSHSSVDEAIVDLAGASLAHFACHARPRVDSPMFSSLVLEDGELTLYDIERLHDVPSTVVLAACSGGAAVQASGEEVLSLAGSFLAMGTRTVVAPLFTVSDEATAQVMRVFYSSLAGGLDPASALLAARSVDDQATAFTAGSFVCFGVSEKSMYQTARN